ncbi:uncharacterized protein LOC143932984 [Lithobates pipiens]
MRPLCYLLLLFVIATLHLEASGFFIGKPGCPIPTARRCEKVGKVRNLCQNDYQCGQYGKCCSNGCSTMCAVGGVLTSISSASNPILWSVFVYCCSSSKDYTYRSPQEVTTSLPCISSYSVYCYPLLWLYTHNVFFLFG